MVLHNDFRPEMTGFRAGAGVYTHVAGIDIVRLDAREFYVLEDNAAHPPASPTCWRIAKHDAAFPGPSSPPSHRAGLALCRRAARHPEIGGAAAASGDPRLVLLTPGMLNSAYYEQAFSPTARHRTGGGRDLFVRDEIIYMRTTEGPKRVDVIYSRIDDDYLDPLTFRPDSVLGMPGLLTPILQAT